MRDYVDLRWQFQENDRQDYRQYNSARALDKCDDIIAEAKRKFRAFSRQSYPAKYGNYNDRRD